MYINKLRVYFAHPSKMIDSDDEKRIIEILKSRQLDVINPFEKEASIRAQIDLKTWKGSMPKNIARQLWISDLSFINICDIIVAWFPIYEAIGTAAEVQHALDLQKKYYYTRKNYKSKGILIQIISKIRHPLFAYALQHGNQLYDTIDDFERFRLSDW